MSISEQTASEQTVNVPGKTKPAPPPADEPDQTAHANAAILFFQTESQRVKLDEGAEVFLGRTHPTNTVDPQVDLTAYEAPTKGVSRIHAAIHRDQAGWWLIDLDSSNGTWVNGQRLAPHQRYKLRGENEVQFARLTFRLALIQEH